MIVLLSISCGAVFILHRILNPIGMLQMSRSCFPALCFDIIWSENDNAILGPILHFISNPTEQRLKESNKMLRDKTGQDLLFWSIRNGYHQVIKLILKYETVDLQLIKDAINTGEIKVIKVLLMEAKKQEIKGDFDETSLEKVTKILPYERGTKICQLAFLSKFILDRDQSNIFLSS